MKLIERLALSFLVLLFFIIGYKWAERGHIPEESLHFTIPFDLWLPRVPEFIVFYILGYLAVFILCFSMRDTHKYHAASSVFIVTLITSFMVFKFMPVYYHKELIPGGNFFERMLYVQQKLDVPFNNFPSLHVSLNGFAALIFAEKLPKFKWLFAVLFVLIASSTLFVKQHMLADVVGGIVVAGLAYAAYKALCQLDEKRTRQLYLASLCIPLVFFLFQLDRMKEGLFFIWKFYCCLD